MTVVTRLPATTANTTSPNDITVLETTIMEEPDTIDGINAVEARGALNILKHRTTSSIATQRNISNFSSWRSKYRYYFIENRTKTKMGKGYYYFMLASVVANLTYLMAETLDGPNHGSTQPAYSMLPDAKLYALWDILFTVIFTFDICMKITLAKSQKKVY